MEADHGGALNAFDDGDPVAATPTHPAAAVEDPSGANDFDDDGSDDDFNAKAWRAFRQLAIAGKLDVTQFIAFADKLQIDIKKKQAESMFQSEKKRLVDFAIAVRLLEAGQHDDANLGDEDDDATDPTKVVKLPFFSYMAQLCGGGSPGSDDVTPTAAGGKRIVYSIALPQIPPFHWITISSTFVFIVVVAIIFATLGVLWSQRITSQSMESLRSIHDDVVAFEKAFNVQERRVSSADLADLVDTLRNWVAKDLEFAADTARSTSESILAGILAAFHLHKADASRRYLVDWQRRLHFIADVAETKLSMKWSVRALRFQMTRFLSEHQASSVLMSAAGDVLFSVTDYDSPVNTTLLNRTLCSSEMRASRLPTYQRPSIYPATMYPSIDVALNFSYETDRPIAELPFDLPQPYKAVEFVQRVPTTSGDVWLGVYVPVMKLDQVWSLLLNSAINAANVQLFSASPLARVRETMLWATANALEAEPASVVFPVYDIANPIAKLQARTLSRPVSDMSHCQVILCATFATQIQTCLNSPSCSRVRNDSTMLYDESLGSFQGIVMEAFSLRFIVVVAQSEKLAARREQEILTHVFGTLHLAPGFEFQLLFGDSGLLRQAQ